MYVILFIFYCTLQVTIFIASDITYDIYDETGYDIKKEKDMIRYKQDNNYPQLSYIMCLVHTK
jgi:hypothetical protein